MNPTAKPFLCLVFSAVSLFARFPATARAEASNKTIVSRTAENDGVRLHYLTAGRGPSLILLHGYAETSLMWKPIMPGLAERFTVIAPDLPGIGDSAIPADGLDMKTSAVRTHARRLGLLRFIPTGRQRFRPTLPNQADHAGPLDRRREVTGKCARTTNEIGGNECNCSSAQRHGTLDPGRKSQGHDRRTHEVSLRPFSKSTASAVPLQPQKYGLYASPISPKPFVP